MYGSWDFREASKKKEALWEAFFYFSPSSYAPLPHRRNEENHPTSVGFPFTRKYFIDYFRMFCPFFSFASPTFRISFNLYHSKRGARWWWWVESRVEREKKSFQHFSGCFPSPRLRLPLTYYFHYWRLLRRRRLRVYFCPHFNWQ